MCRPSLFQKFLSDLFAAFPMFASAFFRVIVFQGIIARLEFMLGFRDEDAHFPVREYLREIVEFIVELGLGIPFECVKIGGRGAVLMKNKGDRSSPEGITHFALECHDFAILYLTLDNIVVFFRVVAIGHKIAVLVLGVAFPFSFLEHSFPFIRFPGVYQK